MKKKLLSCCLCMALLISACACSADTTVAPDHTDESAADSSGTGAATDNAGTEDASGTDDEQISGMPNPIVPIDDASEFDCGKALRQLADGNNCSNTDANCP